MAWVYLPVRQWLWRNLTRQSGEEEFRAPFTDMLRIGLATDSPLTPAERWQALLRRRFAPLHIREQAKGPVRGVLVRGGAELHLPALPGLPALALCHAAGGARLFTTGDQHEADLLARMFSRILEFRSAAARGAEDERQRAAQDLHDDVAPSLLSLIYRAEDTRSAEAGRGAMQQLRQAIRDLRAGLA